MPINQLFEAMICFETRSEFLLGERANCQYIDDLMFPVVNELTVQLQISVNIAELDERAVPVGSSWRVTDLQPSLDKAVAADELLRSGVAPSFGLLGFRKGPAQEAANFFGGSHGLERARDHLGRAATTRVVRSFGFQELRVREDDSQLVVQTVEEKA